MLIVRHVCNKPILRQVSTRNPYFPIVHTRCLGSVPTKENVRIGCSSGFWGDTSTSSGQLVRHGNIQFLVSDYLSEITMSLLTGAKRKNPEMGYAPDFVGSAIGPLIKEIKQKGIRVVSNAGGTNPQACANALIQAAEKVGENLDIAVVLGDDMMPQLKELYKEENIRDLGNGGKLPKSVMSMNAYFGALPIKKALDAGAEVVITGRCVDSAMVLAPLMHLFKWGDREYDKLACGSLAGHLLECGAQSTGGIFTDWETVPDWDNIGFPIAECYEDGEFVITKPDNTGGMVSIPTVAEQMVYEIGDPCNYILPDVNCDFSNVVMSQEDVDRVLVKGAKGKPPTDTFKICATYLDGFRATVVASIGGKRAIAKGHRTMESIIKRVSGLFKSQGLPDFRRVYVHAIGEEKLYGNAARKYNGGDGPRETMMWCAVEHDDRRALELFAREIAPAGTGMAPGLCGIVGGRPKPSPVLKLFSFYHPKSRVPATFELNKGQPTGVEHGADTAPPSGNKKSCENEPVDSGPCSFILEELAYARSGDKGNDANIGVIARDPAYLPYIREHVTADVVRRYFAHLFDDDGGDGGDSPVTRYELPGVGGFNFVMRNCLGGGGVASLRFDPQGKSFAQMLLDIELKGLPELIKK